jgi:filamentous hemagglutinin family protein
MKIRPFLLALFLVFAGESISFANPQGLTVVSGSAQSSQQGNTLQITTSQNAFLQWSSFNIAAGETTIFQQPSATSIVFNQIKNADPSTIFGSLRANGIVVLQNQNGFYFGPNAFISAGGLVVTTAAINPWGSAGGAGWTFDGPPAAIPIVNYGHLETASGGSLFLIANQIDNQGTIQAPGGTAALVAGQQVLLSARPDGLGLSAPVQLPVGSVNNQGQITADAGQVLLQAQNVNNSGLIQANSVREQNGVVELYASQDIQLAGSSVIQANGDGSGNSQGGNVTIKSASAFSDSAGSQINVLGGGNGGNGGSVEVSAPNMASLNSRIDGGAQPGFTDGQLLLDPATITLANTAAGGDTDVNTAFENMSQITLQATGTITVSAGTTWNLSASTGVDTGQLTLQAGKIVFGSTLASGSIIDPNDWSINLVATAASGVTLDSASYLETAQGNITINSAGNVKVGSGGIVTGIANGAVITSPGGNITITATGNVVGGSSTAGYIFGTTAPGYAVDPNLGGISTANGGNVIITAGGEITAAMPAPGEATAEDFGSGAFGIDPGNVILTAGGDVVGHYVLANGTGIITAVNAGDTGEPSAVEPEDLALSLIKGGWTVNAANDISLLEVRNPNAAFNDATLPNGSPSPYQFVNNYDPSAYVVLNAPNGGVSITGVPASTGNLPRTQGNINVGLVFPPSLTINAGFRGINFQGGSLNLYPSPTGTLDLTTINGGDLSTASSGSFSLSMDDPSGDLHVNDPNPNVIDISGSVSHFSFFSPKPLDLEVAGNIIDCSATIENLQPYDTSIISAGGQIMDQSTYVLYTLPAGVTPDAAALNDVAYPYLDPITHQPEPLPSSVTIPNPNYNSVLADTGFSYASGVLRFPNVMTTAVEDALLAMRTPYLPASVIEQVYSASQNDISSAILPYVIGGPGALQITAASLNLGNGGGIASAGINGFQQLIPETSRGANLDISVAGNLTMQSSAIQSEYGGNINVTAGGSIDIGSANVPSNVQYPLGITTLWGGDISVIANDDVNVDGSRIATYDGGNIFVESLTGDVNAGDGGEGYVVIHKPYVDKNGDVEILYATIPGSGILASSFPKSGYDVPLTHVGDITVDTPEGNIDASQGGIVQIPLGPVALSDPTITLNAGTKAGSTVEYVGNVNATGSGVIGGQVNISATGNINGLVVASLGASVTALQNVSATVLSQGGATVSAGGTVSGTVVGLGSVSVSGASDVAAAFSTSIVSASGSVSGAAVAAAPAGSSSASAAATTQQVNEATQSNSDLASNDEDDLLKKKKKSQLMEYVGRVTVLLPE